MALQKDIIIPEYGITASYHKLLRMEYFCETKQAVFLIGIYVSKESRDTPNSKPISYETVGCQFEQLPEDPRIMAYNYIKTTSKYVDSIDII